MAATAFSPVRLWVAVADDGLSIGGRVRVSLACFQGAVRVKQADLANLLGGHAGNTDVLIDEAGPEVPDVGGPSLSRRE